MLCDDILSISSCNGSFVKSCRRLGHSENLLDASVVIAFYNEAMRTLLRTVHSIIDRSPTQVLREILLIDDGSTDGLLLMLLLLLLLLVHVAVSCT